MSNLNSSLPLLEVDKQTITISTSEDIQQINLSLSDVLLDLDQSITADLEGYGNVFQGHVMSTKKAIEDSLRHRADPTSVATGCLVILYVKK
ncbi:unnamed protein product [Rotaria socialis]|uniref:Uncharacterized protein n=1 Tax=Rotaria socialis TaxID=392032 RepID=A0A817UJL2_9BILA|nr:unnamed protein product [Rotaria socialis]CAF4334271.1 unnamed protein product [Rotaria socialis]